jgi:ribosomal protein L12E/L44/L45/RPP1/RPP2
MEKQRIRSGSQSQATWSPIKAKGSEGRREGQERREEKREERKKEKKEEEKEGGSQGGMGAKERKKGTF